MPTDSAVLANENPQSLSKRLLEYWDAIESSTGIPVKAIGKQSLIAPARCCLSDIGQLLNVEGPKDNLESSCEFTSIEEEIVGKAFGFLREISRILVEKCGF